MAYILENFLLKTSSTDSKLQIRDSGGVVKHTINAYDISSTIVSNNLVKINTRDSLIILDFGNNLISKQALSELQRQIRLLKDKPPLVIDTEIKNYIDSRIGVGVTGSDGPQGPQGAVGPSINTKIWRQNPNISIGRFDYTTYTTDYFGIQINMNLSDVSGYTSNWIYGIDTLKNINNGLIISAVQSNDVNKFLSFRLINGTFSSDIYSMDGEILSSGDLFDTEVDVYFDNSLIPTTGSTGSMYSGTSSDVFSIPDVGHVMSIQTQPGLSFTTAQSILIFSGELNLFVDDDYYDDGVSGLIIATIDNYDVSTGIIDYVVEYSEGVGVTYSSWEINLSGKVGVGGDITGLTYSPGVRNDHFSSTSSVTIDHGNGVYPIVQIIDDSGNTVIPIDIVHTGTSSYTVYLNEGSSGTIITSAGVGLQGPSGHVTRLSYLQHSPENPTSTTSTTGVMMGLSASITPISSGILHILISGDIYNYSDSSGAKVQIRYGTGSTPTNDSSITGTGVGGLINFYQSNSDNRSPYSLNAIVSGLTPMVPVWVDVSLAAVVGGTAEIRNNSMTIFELY